MTIRRAARHDRYSVIPNAAIEDSRLSFKALGLLTYLLSKPDHWSINREHLGNTHTDGVTAVRSALAELRAAGYFTTEDTRDENGRITDRVTVVHDHPVQAAPPPGGKPTSRQPHRVDDEALVSTEGEQVLSSATTEPPIPPGRHPSTQLALVSDPSAAPARRSGQLVSFDAFWDVYPRKVAKRAARQAWERAIRRANPQDILIGAHRYRADPNREDQYTAHPATWLNADRWADDPEPQRQRRGPSGTVAAGRRVMAATAGMTPADLPAMSGQAARVAAMLEAGQQ